jgi:hypothetical protein
MATPSFTTITWAQVVAQAEALENDELRDDPLLPFPTQSRQVRYEFTNGTDFYIDANRPYTE